MSNWSKSYNVDDDDIFRVRIHHCFLNKAGWEEIQREISAYFARTGNDLDKIQNARAKCDLAKQKYKELVAKLPWQLIAQKIGKIAGIMAYRDQTSPRPSIIYAKNTVESFLNEDS